MTQWLTCWTIVSAFIDLNLTEVGGFFRVGGGNPKCHFRAGDGTWEMGTMRSMDQENSKEHPLASVNSHLSS